MRIAALDVGSNSFHLIVADVGTGGHINVLDRAHFEEGLELPPAIEPLAERDRGRDQSRDLLQSLAVFGQQRLFDE